ncbi:hypothetical protein CEP53_013472 [Fusarium sp. AF-6]|nr:hypothetical protein CEP53_013472 [Fusarium sp. AF-6]
MKLYFAIGLMFSSLVTGAGIGLGHDMSAPECVATCSRSLLRYRITSHYDTPTRAVCIDMAKQRELFLCLASSCGDDYGPALAYTISACSNHGALITDLLPVELQHGALLSRRFSHLAPGLDTGRFAFGKQLTLAIDCTAGSNGVLTLSLPRSSAVGDSPLVPGSGAGDPNLESSPPAGSTDPNPDSSPPTGNTDPNLNPSPPTSNTDPNLDSNLGSQPGLPSTSNGGQSGTFAHAASNNPGHNDGPSNGVSNSAATDTDCSPETEDSHNNPSGAPNNGQAQHPSGSSPNGDNSSTNGQPDGQMNPPSPNPADGAPTSPNTVPGNQNDDAGTGASSSPAGPNQGTSVNPDDGSGSDPGSQGSSSHSVGNAGSPPSGHRQETPGQPPSQSQTQPAPVPAAQNPGPSTPAGGAGMPGQANSQGGTGEDCENGTAPEPGSGASGNTSPQSPPGSQGNPVDCAIGTDNPACGNQSQGPPGTPHVPSPDTQNPGGCPERASGSPDCGAPSGPSAPPTPPAPSAPQEPAPAPSPAVPIPGQGDQPPTTPAPPSVPNPSPGPDGGPGNPGSPPTGPSPTDGSGQTCAGSDSSGSCGSAKTLPGPQQPSSPSGSPSSSVPPTQGQTNPSPNGNSLSCDGSTGLCPDNPSTPENEPVPYGQESSPINQVPSSPDGGDGVPSCNGNCPTSPGGSEPLDPGTANSPAQSPGSHNGQFPNDPQAPGDDAASRQPSSPVAGPNQPTKTFIRADRPTTTEFVKANRPQENPSAPNTGHGPQVITVLAPTKVEITQTRIITV